MAEKTSKHQKAIVSAVGFVLGTLAISSVAYHYDALGVGEERSLVSYAAGVELQTRISGQLANTVKKLEAQVATNTKNIGVSNDADIDNVMKEIQAVRNAVAALDKRVKVHDNDKNHLRWVSEFWIGGHQNPAQNRRLGHKIIEFRGRTSYEWRFHLRVWGVRPYWTNTVHVGDTNGIRSPALWLYPSNRRALHIRQSGENYPHVNWNWGCDPADAHYPGVGHWFYIRVAANHHAFHVFINNHLKCHCVFDVAPPAGQQFVWFSDPWHHPAPTTVHNMHFVVY